jgi:hypothetical protein
MYVHKNTKLQLSDIESADSLVEQDKQENVICPTINNGCFLDFYFRARTPFYEVGSQIIFKLN